MKYCLDNVICSSGWLLPRDRILTSIYVLYCDSAGGGIGIHADRDAGSDAGRNAGGNAGVDAGDNFTHL